MNGAPLPAPNGFPLRLVAPGWYGIANAKWLKRIEVRDRRFTSLLMGRDYVTIREEANETARPVWAETSVGRAGVSNRLPPGLTGKVGSDYRIIGAAWGGPIDRVEVKVDDGAWCAGNDRPQRGGRIRLEDLVLRLAKSAARRAHRQLARDRRCRRTGPACNG